MERLGSDKVWGRRFTESARNSTSGVQSLKSLQMKTGAVYVCLLFKVAQDWVVGLRMKTALVSERVIWRFYAAPGMMRN